MTATLAPPAELIEFSIVGTQTFLKAGGVEVKANGEVTVKALKIEGDGSTPTLTNIDAFWNGSTVVAGTSTGGTVTLGRIGSGNGSAGRQVTVNFGTAYASTPHIVLTPKHTGSVGNAYTFHLGAVTNSLFEIYLQVAPTAAADVTLGFTWVVIG